MIPSMRVACFSTHTAGIPSSIGTTSACVSLWRARSPWSASTRAVRRSSERHGRCSAGGATGVVAGGQERTLLGPSTLPVNTWVHVASTYDGVRQRIYINGVFASSRQQTGTLATSNGALRMGGNLVYGEFFQGRIDEVRIYSRMLTDLEIQADMNTPIAP